MNVRDKVLLWYANRLYSLANVLENAGRKISEDWSEAVWARALEIDCGVKYPVAPPIYPENAMSLDDGPIYRVWSDGRVTRIPQRFEDTFQGREV
jgi:hypothetical protein